jgi:hypothetical protein
MVVGVVIVTFSSFFTNYLILYSQYQKDGSAFTELASQSQRMAEVIRGVTDLVSVNANDLTAYTYFSPGDTFTSQIRYYLNPAKTKLMADVTPMTGNPPIGTLITAQKKTYTIISNFYQPSGVNLFAYFDALGGPMSLPITMTDQRNIMDIQINLASPGSHTKTGQTMSLTVSLRNRKTNL